MVATARPCSGGRPAGEGGLAGRRAPAPGGRLRGLHAALPPDGSLILAAHSLAVDGPSWGVLLEDLLALCRGEAPEAPPVPFVRWAEALAPWAEEPVAAAEGVRVGPATVFLGEVETSALLSEALEA